MLLQLLWSAEPWSIQRSPRHRAKALGQASPGVSSVPVQAVALTCSRGPANARAPVQQGVESPGDKRKLLLLPAMLLGWEKEVHIPSGGEGTEQGSPTSWVSALITGLVDKRGMTAAVVHLSSCFLCDFFFFFVLQVPQMQHSGWNKAPSSIQNLQRLSYFSNKNWKLLFQIDLNVDFLLLILV